MLQRFRFILFFGLLANAMAWAGSTAPTKVDAACNSSQFQTVLHPARQGHTEARAYWLSRQLIQWPGKAPNARFRLYYSSHANLVLNQGSSVEGAELGLDLEALNGPVPAQVESRFNFVPVGVRLSVRASDLHRLPDMLKGQLVIAEENHLGQLVDSTALQLAGALDDWYGDAALVTDLGVTLRGGQITLKLWAPTARAVSACVYQPGASSAWKQVKLQPNQLTGVWTSKTRGRFDGHYYTYLVDVFVPGAGIVRNRVTDPYSISLNTNSRRSYIANLDAFSLKPAQWDRLGAPQTVQHPTDLVIYELHVRDFSVQDQTVKPQYRGKYLAFTQTNSDGMRHLRHLADAGMTDVHLLPVFDIATIPEDGCQSQDITSLAAASDSEVQQAVSVSQANTDCFNWGYDPYHFNAPEGSYSTDPEHGAARIKEFRQMVMALHQAGLRVGMDVVYNHTAASGQVEKSVLDRVVPGYYHRLNGRGQVERSTCCDNTATENLMMGKLMVDSVVLWATQYNIDSFRFDLMGHQPRSLMEFLQMRVTHASRRPINLIGEGWNFGEVADGRRFTQASQLSLNGSGIGTFSDRARDAVRGGRAADSGENLVKNQGYINGLVYAPNSPAAEGLAQSALCETADLVRVGLAGSIGSYQMQTCKDQVTKLQHIDYSGQPAGYVSEPAEVVNYVENHDNQTLFDINAYKLPANTTREDRVRVQMLGAAINMFSQGIAYFHAGIDTLRSKSMDANSYDSGDWFNRIDWTYTDNYFATGLPPKRDNEHSYPWIRQAFQNPLIKPLPENIAAARDGFRDLLKIRSLSTLFRLRSANDIKKRLTFLNTGSAQNPTVMVGHLDGRGYPGAVFGEVLYLINVNSLPQTLNLPTEVGKPYVLHPILRTRQAALQGTGEVRFVPSTATFTLPARSVLVYVLEGNPNSAKGPRPLPAVIKPKTRVGSLPSISQSKRQHQLLPPRVPGMFMR